MNKYDKCKEQWDNIFQKENSSIPDKKESGNIAFDNALAWLTEDVDNILDFGCGNGTILLLSALYGTTSHIGIDLSTKAIDNAKIRSKKMDRGQFKFVCGGVEAMCEIESKTMDAVILSNIIDNLYPDDAHKLLNETSRVVKDNGKVLIKLNPYLTKEQIKEWNIKIIKDNVLDDGLILWNNTKEEWINIIGMYFSIEKYEEIFYREYEQYNRLFLVKK